MMGGTYGETLLIKWNSLISKLIFFVVKIGVSQDFLSTTGIWLLSILSLKQETQNKKNKVVYQN